MTNLITAAKETMQRTAPRKPNIRKMKAVFETRHITYYAEAIAFTK